MADGTGTGLADVQCLGGIGVAVQIQLLGPHQLGAADHGEPLLVARAPLRPAVAIPEATGRAIPASTGVRLSLSR